MSARFLIFLYNILVTEIIEVRFKRSKANSSYAEPQIAFLVVFNQDSNGNRPFLRGFISYRVGNGDGDGIVPSGFR
ncbi:MAG: hypothetical protein ACLFO1_07090 [Spirochaetaceae bacterium]